MACRKKEEENARDRLFFVLQTFPLVDLEEEEKI